MVFPILCYVLRTGCDLKPGKAVGEMGHLSHTPIQERMGRSWMARGLRTVLRPRRKTSTRARRSIAARDAHSVAAWTLTPQHHHYGARGCVVSHRYGARGYVVSRPGWMDHERSTTQRRGADGEDG